MVQGLGKMADLLVLLLLVLSQHAAALNASHGCGRNPSVQLGRKTHRTIAINDPIAGPTTREYEVYLPTGYSKDSPIPIMLVYHGWRAPWRTWRQGYHPEGEPARYATVYLKGGDDFDGFGDWQSWNVGNAGDLQSCTADAKGHCYRSCVKQGKCSRCNSYTCLDDVLYSRTVLEHLLNEFCLDTTRIYATGYSNGGQFLFPLIQAMPDTFAAVMPVCGTPFSGALKVPPEAKGTGYVHLHARDDTTIPINGGVSHENWVYTSMGDVLQAWVDVTGCRHKTHLRTEWDGDHGLECHTYSNCNEAVVGCAIDGTHHAFPHYSYALTWEMLSRHRRH